MKKTALALIGLLAAASASAGDAKQDAVMLDLARVSGCLTCHHVEPGAKGPDGLAPVGPAWREVAQRYRGKGGAAAELTRTVMSGSNPYNSHWKGKASGLAMPPNAVAIKEDDAKRLVQWILALDAKKT
jgi:cytochrome c